MRIPPPDAAAPVFTDTLIEIVRKTSGFNLNVVSAEPDAGFEDVTGFMALSGRGGGVIFISAREEDVRTLCSYMTGEPVSGISREDVDDTLCELVNMTAGNVKLRLGNTDNTFSLTPPLVIRGKGMSVFTKDRVPVICRTFGDGNIRLKLKVVLH